MRNQCVFPGGGRGHTCMVLEAAGAPPLSPDERIRLELSYCCSGTFIQCPIFRGIQEGLARRREEVRAA
jgi:hypothetical protein